MSRRVKPVKLRTCTSLKPNWFGVFAAILEQPTSALSAHPRGSHPDASKRGFIRLRTRSWLTCDRMPHIDTLQYGVFWEHGCKDLWPHQLSCINDFCPFHVPNQNTSQGTRVPPYHSQPGQSHHFHHPQATEQRLQILPVVQFITNRSTLVAQGLQHHGIVCQRPLGALVRVCVFGGVFSLLFWVTILLLCFCLFFPYTPFVFASFPSPTSVWILLDRRVTLNDSAKAPRLKKNTIMSLCFSGANGHLSKLI